MYSIPGNANEPSKQARILSDQYATDGDTKEGEYVALFPENNQYNVANIK